MVKSKRNLLLSLIIIIAVIKVGTMVLELYPKEINITAHKERINELLINNNINLEKDIVLEDKNPNVLQVKKIPEIGFIYDEYDENKLAFVMETKAEEKINYSNVIYGYNIDTNEVQEIIRAENSRRYIKNVVYDDGWIFWVEDKDKYDSEVMNGENWKLYGKNLNDNKTILIDKWNGEKEVVNNDTLAPSTIAFRDGVVVYITTQKVDGDDSYYDCVNLYDIKSENKTIIDKAEFNNTRFSKPSIDEGKVVYVAHDIENSKTINPQVRIFDLNTKEIDKIKYEKPISYLNDVLKKGDMLYLCVYKDIDTLPNGEKMKQSFSGGEVSTYNLKIKEWKSFIDNKNIPLEQYKDTTLNQPLYGFYGVNNRYLGVGSTTFSSTFIYDISNNTFFDLLNEKDKSKWKTYQSGRLNSNYCLVSTWDNDKSGVYVFKLAM